MKNSRNLHFRVPVFMFAVFLLISLACGGNVTPERVGSVDDEPASVQQPTEPAPAEAPAESTEATPTEPAPQPTEPPPTNTPPPVETQTFEVGDTVSIGDSVLVVLGWEEVPGDDFSKPDEGKKFVAVEVLLVNQSSSSASISTLLQMSLKDNTGQKYDVDLLASTATQSGNIDGELSSGERVRGKVGFQVPVDVQDLQFVFDADVFGAGKAIVNLGPTPVKVEPPAEIAGETEQQTFQIGDIIEIGTLTLTVNEVTSPAGDDFAKPDEGNKFLVVDLTIENKGTDAANVSSLLQMSLKDPTGQTYAVDLLATTTSGGTSPDGEIASGEKVRGQVGFQVPVDATGLVFVFDADVFGAGKVSVTLP